METKTKVTLVIFKDGSIWNEAGKCLGRLGNRQAAEGYCKRAGWSYQFKKSTVYSLNTHNQ